MTGHNHDPLQHGWYSADLVASFSAQGAQEDLLPANTKLFRAVSAGEAFEKATEAGIKYNYSFTNTENVLVTVTFPGLRALLQVAEELEGRLRVVDPRNVSSATQ